MNNTDKHSLSFPQRNWLLLCIIVAVVCIGATYLVQKNNDEQQNGMQITNSRSSAISGQDSIGIPPDSLRH